MVCCEREGQFQFWFFMFLISLSFSTKEVNREDPEVETVCISYTGALIVSHNVVIMQSSLECHIVSYQWLEYIWLHTRSTCWLNWRLKTLYLRTFWNVSDENEFIRTRTMVGCALHWYNELNYYPNFQPWHCNFWPEMDSNALKVPLYCNLITFFK